MADTTAATAQIDEASKMDDVKPWELKFGIEVSARYHDWRRGTMETIVRFVRGATFVSAILTLLTAFNPLSWAPTAVLWIVGALAVIIACINLLDLVANFDAAATRHTDLYRRFKALQEKVARESDNWKEHIGEWEAEAQAIRRDEPPTMWALYAMCWNQTIDRYQAERQGYFRRVNRWQAFFRNLLHFSPQDFSAQPA